VLLGEFRHSLDAKGRVFIPARWRKEMADGLVITKGPEDCLYVIPKGRFSELASRLGQLSINRRTNRDYGRIFFSSASEEEMDRQGRVNIPQTLRDHAGLTRDVVLAGVHERAEIWDLARWQAYQGQVGGQYETIAEAIEL
jgi:MraZ protein